MLRDGRNQRAWLERLWIAAGLALLAAGCGSSSGSAPIAAPGGVVRQGDTLGRAGSALVLVLPPDLPATISEQALEDVFLRADATPACQNASGKPVEFLLAEACLAYQSDYLFPENLPSSLDGFSDVGAYVEHLRESDPFTAFFTAAELQQSVEPALSGARALIGMRLEISGDSQTIGAASPLTIQEVLPFTRAWYDGVRAGDQLAEVDGQSLDGLTLEQVQELLPHDEGEPTELTLVRSGDRLTVRTAAEENIGRLLEGGIAYLSVRLYSARTGALVRSDVEALLTQSPAARFILDLRGNGGGAVTGALSLIDYLIDDDQPRETNPIVTFVDRDGSRDTLYLGDYPTTSAAGTSQNLEGLSRASFVVLVDGDSASASEITVAALRDYGTAEVIGTPTYGKGVGQDVITLVDGSGLFVTARRILGPEGESWHQAGVSPDILVEGVATQDVDPQLEAAVAWLTQGSVPVAATPRAAARATPEAQRGEPWWRKLSPGYQ